MQESGKAAVKQDRSATVGTRKRLMVVLDWESIDMPARQLLDVNNMVLAIIRDRLGDDWAERLFRIYFAEGDTEAKAWYEQYRSDHLIAAWRTPRHRGRRGPRDWDCRIRKNVTDWCLNSVGANNQNTTMVLVSDGGDFTSMVEKLDSEGVRQLLIQSGNAASSEPQGCQLKEIYGASRCVSLDLEAKTV